MSILTFETWASSFSQARSYVSFEDFSRNVLIENGSGKVRFANEELSKESLEFWYEVIMQKRNEFMESYFIRRLSLNGKSSRIMDYLKGTETCEINQHLSLIAKTPLSRFVRNIQYFYIFDTQLGKSKKFTEVGIAKCLWRRGRIPSVISKCKDWKESMNLICAFSSKASVFPPETVGCIIDRVLQGKYVFFPVIGWTSYLLGHFMSKATHCFGIDANPENIQSNLSLKKGLRLADEKVSISHGRTELQSVPDILTFCGGFDSVFWSPPYFTRELYQGEGQSHKLFKTYIEWLEGFYAPVISICYKVITRAPGKMVVVISDQTVSNEYFPLVADTLRLATNVGFRSTGVFPMCLHGARALRKSSKPSVELMLVFEKMIPK